jgi:hypothetical protein
VGRTRARDENAVVPCTPDRGYALFVKGNDAGLIPVPEMGKREVTTITKAHRVQHPCRAANHSQMDSRICHLARRSSGLCEPWVVDRKQQITRIEMDSQSGKGVEVGQMQNIASTVVPNDHGTRTRPHAIEIIARAPDQQIGSGRGQQGIATIASVERVDAVSAIENIIPGPTGKLIRLFPTIKGIIACVAFQSVASHASAQRVIAFIAEERVVAFSPVQKIGRCPPMEAIIALAAVEGVHRILVVALVSAVTRDHVVARFAQDEVCAATAPEMVGTIATQ